MAAEQNHVRLAGLAARPPGLVIAAIAFDGAGEAARTAILHASGAAAIADLPGALVWAWPEGASSEAIACDLAAARAALGEATRVVLVLRPRASVRSAPLLGEVGAVVDGVDAVPLLRALGGLDEGQLVRGVDVPWSDQAQERASRAGFVTPSATA